MLMHNRYIGCIFVCLVAHGRVIERDANGTSVMAIVLANDRLAVELPETGVMVGASSHQVGRVGAKSAVPNPSLMAMQRRLKREGIRIAVCGAGKLVLRRDVVRLRGVDGPDAGCVVGGAGS